MSKTEYLNLLNEVKSINTNISNSIYYLNNFKSKISVGFIVDETTDSNIPNNTYQNLKTINSYLNNSVIPEISKKSNEG